MTAKTSIEQKRNRTLGILIVGIFAFVCGLGEIVVGITGNYLGILAKDMQPALLTAIVGAFYSLGGICLLITRKKWGAAMGIIFIVAEVLGRIYLVMEGIAPSTGNDFIKIVIGGMIALALVFYIISQWETFR